MFHQRFPKKENDLNADFEQTIKMGTPQFNGNKTKDEIGMLASTAFAESKSVA